MFTFILGVISCFWSFLFFFRGTKKSPEDGAGETLVHRWVKSHGIHPPKSWREDLSSLRRLLQDMRNNAAAVREAQKTTAKGHEVVGWC